MNKFLIAIFLTLFNKTGVSQATIYHPFPLEESEWRTDYFDVLCTSNIYSLCSSYSYYSEGDTIINSLTYTKFYTDLIQYEYVITETHLYIGALREDTFNKKVYFFHVNQPSEYLLFDFNLDLGDTSLGGFTEGAVVTLVDSILVGSEFHRRFNFYNSLPFPIFLVEGIGTNGGIFSGVYDGYGEEKKDVLKCFKLNNITLLEDTSYFLTSCELFTSENNILKPLPTLNISPNPVLLNSNLTINCSILTELFFYDLSGHLIEHSKPDNEGIVFISEVNFNRGAFIVIAKSHDKVIEKKLVLIQ